MKTIHYLNCDLIECAKLKCIKFDNSRELEKFLFPYPDDTYIRHGLEVSLKLFIVVDIYNGRSLTTFVPYDYLSAISIINSYSY